MRIRSGAAVAALACVLSACSTGSTSKPGTLPTLGSATATGAPTALALVVPAAAKEHTRVGAAEFVKFFFTELDKAYQAGKPFPLAGLADPQCKTCQSFASVAQRLQDSQHRFADPTYVDLVAETPPMRNGIADVDVFFSAPTRREVDKDGRVVTTTPAESRKLNIIVRLAEQTDGWIIRATEFQEPR